MDALSEAIARLLARQREADLRLERLERAAGISRPAPATPPLPIAEPQPQPPVPPLPRLEPAPQAQAEEPAESASLESRMGLVWVNRVGVVTFVLGVAFFFRYAVDNGWIGPRGRVLLGILAGLVALGLAEWFRRRNQRTFAQGICGAGVAILYVSLYAAYAFYNLIPHPLAFALMTVNTVGAGALALRYGSPAIAALGLAGGYLTPVVLSTGEDHPWAFLGYVLLLSAGAMAIGRLRRWPGLELLAFAAATTLYGSWLGEFHVSSKPVANVFALAFYALFVSGRFRALAPLCQAAVMIELLAVSLPDAVPFLPLALLVSAAALAIAAVRHDRVAPIVSLAVFWVPYALAHFTLKQHNSPEQIFGFLTLIFLVFSVWAPWKLLAGRIAEAQDLALAVLNAACYFSASYDLLEPAHHSWLGLFAVAIALLHLGIARRVRAHQASMALYAGVALCFTTLAVPIQFTGYRITMGWALEAAALSWIAARAADRRFLWGALAVSGLAVIRVLTVDGMMYPHADAYTPLWNARLLTFLTTAAALWLSAHWARSGGAVLASYVTGHFVLLWGLGLEVLAWAARNASSPDILPLQSTAISILAAAYAVVLVAIGVTRRSAPDRILGLGLIAAVVAKLYLYDVWNFNRGIYRIAAFAGLGLLLLVMSYLYSRFRGSIESWWRDGRAH